MERYRGSFLGDIFDLYVNGQKVEVTTDGSFNIQVSLNVATLIEVKYKETVYFSKTIEVTGFMYKFQYKYLFLTYL